MNATPPITPSWKPRRRYRSPPSFLLGSVATEGFIVAEALVAKIGYELIQGPLLWSRRAYRSRGLGTTHAVQRPARVGFWPKASKDIIRGAARLIVGVV